MCARVVFALSALVLVALAPELALAGVEVEVVSASGLVEVRAPKSKDYAPVKVGVALASGTRLRTGPSGEAKLKYPDGSVAEVRAKSEIIVRPALQEGQPSSVVLFFGRVWTKVVKSVAGNETFEVRSANAVAGVRGTEFETGVAADGAMRVRVKSGAVGVAGDAGGKTVEINAGFEVEASGEGEVTGKSKSQADANWDGWFSARAKALQKEGLRVAKNLDGRLAKRQEKVKSLLAQQKQLRQKIEGLEAQKQQGEEVDEELATTLEELESVTARLVDMETRLQASFAMFERWGAVAAEGGMQGGEEVSKMASNIQKIAADFADMIEEGTDQSQEGMDDLLQDMKKGKSGKPKKGSAADEMFK